MILYECLPQIKPGISNAEQSVVLPLNEKLDIGFKTPVSSVFEDTFVPIKFTDRIIKNFTDEVNTSCIVKTRTINKDLGLTSFNKKYLTTDADGNIIPQTSYTLNGTRKSIDEGFLDEFDISSEYPDLKTVSNMEVV